MGQSPEILAPCPGRGQGGRVFQSGLDPQAQNICQNEEEGLGLGPGLAKSGPFPLPTKVGLDPQDWPPGGASAQVDMPSSQGHPLCKRVSLCRALSPSSLFILPPFLSFPSISLFSLSSCFKEGESRVGNKITKCHSDCREGEKIVSAP